MERSLQIQVSSIFLTYYSETITTEQVVGNSVNEQKKLPFQHFSDFQNSLNYFEYKIGS